MARKVSARTQTKKKVGKVARTSGAARAKGRSASSSAKKKSGTRAGTQAGKRASGQARPVSGLAGHAAQLGRTGVDEVALTREVFWQNVMRELLTSLSILSSQMAARRAALKAASLAIGEMVQSAGKATPAGPIPTVPPVAVPQDGAVGHIVGQAVPPSGQPVGAGVSVGDPVEDEDDEGDEETSFELPENVGVEPHNVFDGRLAVITSLGQRIPIAEVHPVFACGIRGPAGADVLSTIIECTVFEIRTPGGEVYTLPVHEIKSFHALTPELIEELGKAAGSRDENDAVQPFGFAAFTSLVRNRGGLSEVPVVPSEYEGE